MQNRKLILCFSLVFAACGGEESPTVETTDQLTVHPGGIIELPDPIDFTPIGPGEIYPSCGGAGSACCPTGPACDDGLACNPSGVCRTPCGGLNERCCAGGCGSGLECRAGSCRTNFGGGGGGGGGACTPCALRECGWDTSCGPQNQQYCGSCMSGMTCGGGFCSTTTGQECTLQCASGMSCHRDNFGMFCDF